MTTTDTDELISAADAAAMWGVTTGTWRGYVSKGYAPQPDDPDDGRPANRRQPRWRRSTVASWPRRGQAWRAAQR